MGIKTFMLNKRKKQLVSNCADSFFKPASAQAEYKSAIWEFKVQPDLSIVLLLFSTRNFIQGRETQRAAERVERLNAEKYPNITSPTL